MADKASEQEPSIEEILASIRQIITDDDDKPAAPAPAPVAEKPAPAPEPVNAQSAIDDVFNLTPDMQTMTPAKAPEPAFEPEPEPIIDMMEPEPPKPVFNAAPEPDMSDILSERTRQSTIASMARLAGNMPINRPKPGMAAVTLEDIVREMLHPMLRDWMDGNLTPMVERLVQKELEKLARKAMDE
jgi:cell pole-organizing protein PopZ